MNSSVSNGAAVTYDNDVAGRVETLTYPSGQIISYVYDDTGAVTDIDARNGSATEDVADYLYDSMGRVTDVFFGDGGKTEHDYDPIGRLEDHTLKRPGEIVINQTSLDYNPASQIVSRSVTQGAYQTAMPTGSPGQYTPNSLNQYASVDNGNPLDYDLNGNLTDYDGWSYTFDAHNRMKTASGPGTSLSLAYDPTSRLKSTTLASGTTHYVYSGDQLIGEYTSASAVSPINLYVFAPGSDIPIARFSGTAGVSDMQYLRSDERGSIVAVTDEIVLDSNQYDVYGVPLDASSSLFRYTGQIQLPGTELYHYKARVYHPSLGRFMQTDPIGYEDGMNMYAYVHNDPVNMRDPTGKVACGGACIAGGVALVYRGYKAYKAYKALKKARQVAVVAQAANESIDSEEYPDDYVEEKWDDVVWGDRDADGPYNPVDFDSESGGDNQDNDGHKDDKAKKKNEAYGKGAEHKKRARKSTKNKHEKGRTRAKRDQGGEKADERRYRRK